MRAADAVEHVRGTTAGRRAGTLAATGLMWGVDLALWAPVVHRLTDRGDVGTEQGPDTVRALLWVGVSAFVLASMLIGWAEYNRIRFTGVERRHRPADVAPQDVGAALGAEPDVVEALQRAAVSRVVCREDGSALAVEVVLATPGGGSPLGPAVPATLPGEVPAQRSGSAPAQHPVTGST